MIRAASISLALMGGSAVVGTAMVAPALVHRNDPCREARAAFRADAEEICARQRSGSTGSGRSGYYRTSSTRSGSSTAVASRAGTSSIARGGFGAAGAHASAGG
jgi:hypothetical protein